MKFIELKKIIQRLYKEYIKFYFKRILFCLVLSICVAGTSSAIAWLLDPAVKKIFVEQDKFLTLVIPFLIILAFSGKGLSLYFARLIIIRVGNEVAAELQKKITKKLRNHFGWTECVKHNEKICFNPLSDGLN